MDQTTITARVRQAIREPSPRFVSDSDIEAATIRACKVLGLMIKKKDTDFMKVRASLTSTTHVFTWPTNARTINRVWDMGTSAITITGASSASPIVITAASHGFSDDDIVIVHDVGGNTAANGTFKITYIGANSFSLDGSTYNAAYTSGGKVFAVTGNDWTPMDKISLDESTMQADDRFFMRGRAIVVDYPEFTNDLVVDYTKIAAELTDIDDEYHDALVSWDVINLIRIPDQEAKDYGDKVETKAFHTDIWKSMTSALQETLETDTVPYNIPETWHGGYGE